MATWSRLALRRTRQNGRGVRSSAGSADPLTMQPSYLDLADRAQSSDVAFVPIRKNSFWRRARELHRAKNMADNQPGTGPRTRMLKRDEWLASRASSTGSCPTCREQEAFPEVQSGSPWLPHAEWRDWDEPYRTSYPEYVADAAARRRRRSPPCARRSAASRTSSGCPRAGSNGAEAARRDAAARRVRGGRRQPARARASAATARGARRRRSARSTRCATRRSRCC